APTCNPSGGIKVMEHSFGLSGGHSVRLVSQSSEHLLLLTVEGSQATAIPVQKAW
ncbi:hypothetical protein L195_g057072, partial [Trifolium pratense]